MAQVPTSSITMAQIKAETGVATDATLDAARAASISYVRGTGESPAGTGGNANATPNNMRDWAGYLHLQDFGTPTYYAKTGTATSDYCITTAVTATSNEAIANAANIFYAILNNTTVEFYMLPDHTLASIAYPEETASWKNAAGTNQSFSGNFSSGFTPVKIAQLDTGSVSNREVSITTAVLQGTGNYRTTISGYTNQGQGTFFTPSSTKNMRAPAATATAACYNSVANDVYTSVEFRVKATGYNTKVFNKFISNKYVNAISNNCL
jgi:hypothetical protein